MNKKIDFSDYKICDAHLHLADCSEYDSEMFNSPKYFCISSSHSVKEFEDQSEVQKKFNLNAKFTFGIHPQKPSMGNASFLEKLLTENKINAVGECGFDFYTKELKSTEDFQKTAFEYQLSLSVQYNKPLVIHARKCMDKLFSYSKELAKVPSVIFHSFMGTPIEAESLLRHGINAFFSFGKPLLNGNRKAVECVTTIDKSRLLLETDAPFQTLKGELYTDLDDILKVYEKACMLMGYDTFNEESFGTFSEMIYDNFIKASEKF